MNPGNVYICNKISCIPCFLYYSLSENNKNNPVYIHMLIHFESNSLIPVSLFCSQMFCKFSSNSIVRLSILEWKKIYFSNSNALFAKYYFKFKNHIFMIINFSCGSSIWVVIILKGITSFNLPTPLTYCEL